MNLIFQKIIAFVLLILAVFGIGYDPFVPEGKETEPVGPKNMLESPETAYDYGVFIGIGSNLARCEKYDTVIIDAQYFSEEEIKSFSEKGHKVYSYLNIGSLENYRSYYKRFLLSTLGSYENWGEERWMDVSKEKWQSFILDELVPEMLRKGVDGFFVDNCDVYYNYPKKSVYDGLVTIMQGLVKTGKKVIINSGDCFVDEYCKNGGRVSDIITGINQESVFTSIQWETSTFGEASEETNEYFTAYIEKYASMGTDIYLLEYTSDRATAEKAEEYCKNHGFTVYITDSIELK